MIDAHCHIQEFEDVTTEVVNATKTGITDMICAGAGVEDSARAMELSNIHPELWATVGLGYENKYENLEKLKNKLEVWTTNKKVVGVGECGLDYWEGVSEETKNKQRELFRMHVEVATKTGLPLVVHSRNAFEDVFNNLKSFSGVGQMHCFTGDVDWMKRFVNMGWYISFGGIVTFKKSGDLREVLKQTPDNRLLIETDSPYLAPEPYRGSRNSPANVKIVASVAAEALGVTVEEIGKITAENTKKLFRKMDSL